MPRIFSPANWRPMTARAGLLLAALALSRTAIAAAGSATAATNHIDTSREPFELILWLDHFDYTVGVPDAVKWSTMTPTGIETIVSYMALCGRPTVAYRDFAGGLVRHNSRIELGQYPQRLDKRRAWDMRPACRDVRYGEARHDILASVVASCSRHNLRCIIYWPFEDVHGLPCFYSRFALEHPQFWERHRDGYASPARLSLAYPEVRRYKLEILREEMTYGVDGVMFDFRRQSGLSHAAGYDPPAIAAWRAIYHTDPPDNASDERWIRLRASYVTQFLREARAVLDAFEPRRRLICSIPNAGPDPRSCLHARLTDWPTWVNEGLLDGLAVSELPLSSEGALDSICSTMAAIHRLIADRCKVYWPLKWYNAWTIRAARQSGMSLHAFLRQYVRRAWRAGAAGFVMDTYDYGMAGMTADTQALLAELFTRAYPRMKPGRVRLPRPCTAPLPRAYRVPSGPSESGLVRLTDGPGNHSEPAWSPDGRWIAFQSDASGSLDIYLASPRHGHSRRFIHSRSNDCFPAWSPDSRRLAFASDRDGGYYHIFVTDLAGRTLLQLTHGPHHNYTPTWSPDGRHIYFASTRGYEPYGTGIWRVPAAGGDVEPLAGLSGSGFPRTVEPSLSPDGSFMAFAAASFGLANWQIAVHLLGPPEPERAIVLTSHRQWCYAPALAPDGKCVAYSAATPDGYALYVRPLGAEEAARVTSHPGNNVDPCWSPDSKKLCFASNRSGSYKLYTLPAPTLYDQRTAQRWADLVTQLRRQARAAAAERKFLDQSNPPRFANSQASAGYAHQVAQSFVPSRTGVLLKLRLYMTRDAGTEPLTVQLRGGTENAPAGPVLAETQVPASRFESAPQYSWVEVRFDPPPTVQAGNTYWIFIPLGGRYHWAIDAGHHYSRGRAYSDRYGYGGYDWIFEVYVR